MEDNINKTIEEIATSREQEGKITDFGYYFLAQKIDTQIDGLRKELKTDISDLRQELKTDISDLRQELKADIKELRQEVTSINSRLDNFNGRFDNVNRWFFGAIVTIIVGFVGVIATMLAKF